MTETLTGRLNFRATADQERALRRAAALTGQSVSGFVLSSAVEHAHEMLARASKIELSESTFRMFVAALDLDEPAEAVPELARLFEPPKPHPGALSQPALCPVELLDPDRNDTGGFDCVVPSLDEWLSRTAAAAAAAGMAATWVLGGTAWLATTPSRWGASNGTPRRHVLVEANRTPFRSSSSLGSLSIAGSMAAGSGPTYSGT